MPLTDTLSPGAPLTEHTPTEGSPFIKSYMSHAATIPNPDAPAAPAPKPDAPETPAATPDPKAATTTPETPKQPEQTKSAETTTTDIPDTITSAKAADWKKLKQLREDADKRASDFEKQYKAASEELTKLKSQPAIDPNEYQAKLDALQKERDDYSERLKRTAIEQHPQFQSFYGAQIDSAKEQARAIAGEKGDLAVAILDAPENSAWRKSALNTMLSEMESEADKLMLVGAMRDHDKVRRERDDKLKNSRDEYKRMVEAEKGEAQKRESAQAKAQAENIEKVTNHALEVARNYESFKASDEPAQIEVAKNSEELLKRMITRTVDGETALKLVVEGIDYKRLKSQFDSLAKERDELKAAVAAYQQGNPGLQGGETKDGQTAQVQTPYGPSPFMTSIKQGFREAGVTR